jgi:hypothetical protein
LAAAKRSHFVGGLGFGSGFARGSWVVGGGSCANGPSGEERVGREKRVASKACVPVVATDSRYSSWFELQSELRYRS